MRIENTKEIKAYLKRLEHNLNNNYQNDYLDSYIDKSLEKEAKKELYDAGQIECLDKDMSLFISTDDFLNNPYHKNVVFKILENKEINYSEITYVNNQLFNYDSLIEDHDKELKDYMCLRALDKNLKTIILKENNIEWMMAVPSESKTNDPYALKAKGKTITFGLGIGYFIYMAMLNRNVKEITVIEKSKEVINIFNRIRKYFPNNIPLNIINGDAYDYFNESYLRQFDYIYVDIYQNNNDGLLIMEKLLSIYNPPIDKCDFWIESSITSIIKTLIYLIYKEIYTNKKAIVTKNYQDLLNKTRNYFNNIDIEINDVNTLKEYMYSKEVIRKILSQ